MKNILKIIFIIVFIAVIVIFLLCPFERAKNKTSNQQLITPTQEIIPTVSSKSETEEDLQKLIDADKDSDYEEELKGLETETQ